MNRKAYPSDISDEEWEFVVPYLTLMKEDAAQCTHALREFFNALRWFVRAGWLARYRWLSRDYERLSTTLAGLHWLAFARLPLSNFFKIRPQS